MSPSMAMRQRTGNDFVGYTITSGTALPTADYTASSGTLTFSPGQTSKTIPITIVNDNLYEQPESFSIVLSNPSNVTLQTTTATITIKDDDPNPFQNVRLVRDTGHNKEDKRTVNPTIEGTIVGNYGTSSVRVEFDHNQDGVVDGFVALASIPSPFEYDPRISDPSLVDYVGYVPLRYRLIPPLLPVRTPPTPSRETIRHAI